MKKIIIGLALATFSFVSFGASICNPNSKIVAEGSLASDKHFHVAICQNEKDKRMFYFRMGVTDSEPLYERHLSYNDIFIQETTSPVAMNTSIFVSVEEHPYFRGFSINETASKDPNDPVEYSISFYDGKKEYAETVNSLNNKGIIFNVYDFNIIEKESN